MTDTPWDASSRETGVTIKAGKGYDDSWFTFRGKPEDIKADIIAFFGLDSASVSSLTAHEVAVNARKIAQGLGAVGVKLGGEVVAAGKAEEVLPSTTPEDKADAPNPLLAQIEACKSTDELKRLWAENQAAFADQTITAAWKARGKALKTN